MTGHRVTLSRLLEKHRWNTGAELGVQQGILSRLLLDVRPKLSLIGVDNFTLSPEFRQDVEDMVPAYSGRFTLLPMSTEEAAQLVEDRSLDFVFIDADHAEESVLRDIESWHSKVKPGGWIGGDDYNPTMFPGVIAAVNRSFHEGQVEVLPGRVWGVWC